MARPVIPPDGPEVAAAVLPLTPAIEERLTRYVALLGKWQAVKNLVAPSTLGAVWRRHVADSAQALKAAPDARRWLDLGSGAGFPGLVIACYLADEPGAQVTLVESNGRKAAFLAAVIRELGLPAAVISERIESLPKRSELAPDRVDAVSARALAPLDRLLDLAAPWIMAGASGVFHKGQDFASEYAAATQSWVFNLVEHQSVIESDSLIAVVTNLSRRARPEPSHPRA